ncbi:MAG: ABC transporter permease [Rhizobiales bacterium]|nr:ABC transporter permease [Hyphomicrobiales bacterium]
MAINIKSIARALNVGNGIVISLVILALFIAAAAWLIPAFFHAQNISNILRVFASAGIMAIGLSLVLLIGEIDVSVGSIMSLAVMSSMLFIDQSEYLAIGVLVLVGALCGLVNGIVVAKLKVPSLMVTIGTLSLFGGLASIVVNAQTKFISDAYPLFLAIAKGDALGVPNTFVFCTLIAVVAWIITAWTRFGRSMYYIGANKRAAYFSGVDVDTVKISVFVISGVLAAIAGMLITTQIGRAKSDVGNGYEVTAIAIAMLGGTSLFGGRGSPLGVLFGMVTLGVLTNILALSKMGSHLEIAMKGVLVIAVVYIYELLRRVAR